MTTNKSNFFCMLFLLYVLPIITFADESYNRFIESIENNDFAAFASILARSDANTLINKKDENGMTPLMSASFRGRYKMANMLIEKGANVDSADKLGGTSLMYAALFGRIDIAELLLENNANRHAVHSNGMTAELIAIKNDHHNVARLLNKKSPYVKYNEELLPAYYTELNGSNLVKITNPNDFKAFVGLRSEGMGKNFIVYPYGVKSVTVPNGNYNLYLVYSSEPTTLYRGDNFSLNNSGVEIRITSVVNGNYSIHREN